MVYGVPVIVTPEDGSFHPRMEDIEQAVSSYTKAIIVNSPNNPSGVVYPEEFIAEIVEFCERKKHLPDHGRHLPQAGLRRQAARRLPTSSRRRTSRLAGHRRQRHLEAVRHDRVPHRLGGRAAAAGRDHDQRPGADHVVPSPVLQAARRRRADRPAERRREPAPDDPEQPRRHDAGAAVVQRRARRIKPDGTFYCLPDFRAYNKQFGGAVRSSC